MGKCTCTCTCGAGNQDLKDRITKAIRSKNNDELSVKEMLLKDSFLALMKNNWERSGAAHDMGISTRTMFNRVKKLKEIGMNVRANLNSPNSLGR